MFSLQKKLKDVEDHVFYYLNLQEHYMLQGSAIWEKLKAALGFFFLKKYGKIIHMKVYGFFKKVVVFNYLCVEN